MIPIPTFLYSKCTLQLRSRVAGETLKKETKMLFLKITDSESLFTHTRGPDDLGAPDGTNSDLFAVQHGDRVKF